MQTQSSVEHCRIPPPHSPTGAVLPASVTRSQGQCHPPKSSSPGHHWAPAAAQVCQNMWTWNQRWFQDISELSKAACTPRNTGNSIKNHFLLGICWLGCSAEGKAAHTHGCSCSSCLGDYFTGTQRPSGCWRCGPGWPKFSSTASCHKPFPAQLPWDISSTPLVQPGPDQCWAFLDTLSLSHELFAKFLYNLQKNP